MAIDRGHVRPARRRPGQGRRRARRRSREVLRVADLSSRDQRNSLNRRNSQLDVPNGVDRARQRLSVPWMHTLDPDAPPRRVDERSGVLDPMLIALVDVRRLRPAPDRRRAADDPGQRRAAPAARLRARCDPPTPTLLVRAAVHRRAVGALPARPRAGLRLQRRRGVPVPRSTSTSSAARAARRSGPSRTRSSRWTSSACPTSVARFAHLPRGLVLVTGPDRLRQDHHAGRAARPGQPHPVRRTSSPSRTRSSSSTRTSAAWSTSARSARTPTTFAAALKHALRQDPDIILVGELRDLETTVDRADRRRDRPPGAGHPAHAERRADHRPGHRHLPAAPAAADPRAARGQRCRAW